MSEFDTAGFSAVDRFFGGGEEKESSKRTSGRDKQIVPDSSQHPKGKRRGVGSAAVLNKEAPNDLTKKLLKVGRKRDRDREDDDDDDGMNQEVQDDDEEEEGGRTAIAPKDIVNQTDAAETLTNEAKSKKKLGKKERMKKQEEGGQRTEGVTHENQGDDSQSGGTTKDLVLVEGDPSSTGENAQKKHRRRKIRSKQKNIRKDNRETKPDHLVVGQKRYQGRPLTAETRAKLNLPEPKIRTHLVVESHRDEELVGDGTGLAIDDLLEDSGEQVQPQTTTLDSVKKAEKKRKKPRYKNLKV